MKRIFFLTAILLFVIYFGSMAQTQTEVATTRQASWHARIAEGRASGELTKREAPALHMEQRHINRSKRKAKSDGEVTPAEKARINREQNRANRHIRRQKHDDQERGDNR